MLRLMGLPHVGRWPRATVLTGEEQVEIVFSGEEGQQTLGIPVRALGGIDDLESFELRLLAQLQSLGYEVERAHLQ